MRRTSTLGLVSGFALASLVGGTGCTQAETAPPPPGQVDSGRDGSFVTPPRPRTDAGPRDVGTPTDASVDMGSCLPVPTDARILFVLDRSTTMAEFALGGDGSAFNVIASTAAADLIAPLPTGSEAGLLLFPNQTFDEPDCPGVSALAQQYPLRSTDTMEGTLRALWATEGVIQGKPRERALQRAAEGLTDTDLSDTLVVLFTDTALGCTAPGTTDGELSLSGRGARVVTITLASSSAPAEGATPARYSSASEVLAALQPELDAVRRRCENP